MKVTGSSVEQLEKDRPRSKCRRWRLWATTECGRKSKRVRGTWTDAQNAMKRWIVELGDKIPTDETFAAYAAFWRSWRASSGDFAPGTLENDARNVHALCRTELADMKLDEITPPDCRCALAWLKAHPSRKTRTGQLSNTTMNKLHMCLAAILQQAVDDGKAASNPMAKIKAPRPDTKEREALEPDRLMALLDALDGAWLDGRVMAVYFMACLGLRRGEACALADGDVRDGLVHVHSAIKERDGTIAEPKSAASVRTLPMPPRLAVKVDDWRELRARLGWTDAPTLCCNTRGGVLRPQLLQRWWTGDAQHNGVSSSLGCDGMTLHQLRHSNLSMMARHMSPFDLQRYAGWSSIEPAKVYVHDDLDSVSAAVASAWK